MLINKLTQLWYDFWYPQCHVSHSRYKLHKEHKEIMAAIDNLNGAVADLAVAVDAAVTALSAPKISEADVQAAADAVKAQKDKLILATTVPTV